MFHVAVVGATGAVGQELLRVLERREFPVASLKALASARSAGTTLPFRGEQVPVAEATPASFEGTAIAFFSGQFKPFECLPIILLPAGLAFLGVHAQFDHRLHMTLFSSHLQQFAGPFHVLVRAISIEIFLGQGILFLRRKLLL